MRNRHIDQIMLCVVYGVCKVNKLKDVAFRKILEKYRLQPHSCPKVRRLILGRLCTDSLYQTYRVVVLASKDETGDIIKFYNSVFIPRLESFLVQFSAAPALSAPHAIPLAGSASPFVMPHSPLRLGANLSVSSPAASARTESRSSTPRVHYSFGQSPSKVL